MTTILRLEGLDVNAGTKDIRGFFEALHIPDGGVYIVGGSLGEAFIAFGTESEAQLALQRSGNLLKGSMVTLHLSSMEEMEKKLEKSLKEKRTLLTVRKPKAANETSRPHADINRHKKPKSGSDGVDTTKARLVSSPRDGTAVSSSAAFPLDPDTADLPASNALQRHLSPANRPASDGPLDTGTAFLLGVCTVLKGLASTQTAGLTFEFPKADGGTALSDKVSNPEHASDSRPGYVRLFGLPASTTKDDICKFFKGLHVQEAIVNVELGISRGSLVKFASKQEATDALGFNQQLLGSTSVEVRGADEKMWEGALQECRNAIDDWSESRKRFPKERSRHERKSVSSLPIKRKPDNQVQFKPFKKPKPDGGPDASLSKPSEYRVMVRNLPRNITKTDIKELFGCPGMPHKDVLHLLDETRSLTDTAFLAFKRPEDFDYAINLSGCHVGSGNIEVTPITKNVMWEMMAKNHPRNQRTGPTDPRLHGRLRKPDPLKTEAPQGEGPERAARRHVFIRNMPANVKRSQIRSLFCKFNLCLGDIVLLQDGEGGSRGEAVVTFESEEQAALAQTMHGEEFLGTKVLLTRINVEQKEKILNS
ncbi:RNA binding motif protein 12Ba [Fundulus heteroclitus]|uniref:RNA binding motif protein 12Ba n=1 Tax=Fundulus heteroclitus TaxID=8078 RepID=UPI00165C25ED|nr:RNA binding motif protein 12Ba [Fundulus heteroclitus]